jgi:uncharacterized membrane protein YcjF (UPF0283 family)
MQELISPEQSDKLVLLAAVVLCVLALRGAIEYSEAGASAAGIVGPLVFVMWQFHKWITRYDPQSGYFGLDKVWVLLTEVVLFVVIGAILGTAWGKLVRLSQKDNLQTEAVD